MMKTVSFYISQEASDVVDALVIERRKATGEGANRSTVVDALILSTKPIKRVVPVFEQVGKRRKLVGFDAFYGDRFINRFDRQPEADAALDAFAHEELSK